VTGEHIAVASDQLFGFGGSDMLGQGLVKEKPFNPDFPDGLPF